MFYFVIIKMHHLFHKGSIKATIIEFQLICGFISFSLSLRLCAINVYFMRTAKEGEGKKKKREPLVIWMAQILDVYTPN